MPFYYDLTRAITTNGSANTESTHLWGKTAANQETVGISGLYIAARFGTAGGAQIRLKDNTGTTASGGTGQTPVPRNRRGSPAAQSIWANDATAITPGATLLTRVTIGFAQTGGMGGWVATEPTAKIQMMPNATNPVDVEITSLASSASVTADLSLEFGEGI
jgi:hypothetical protein